MGRRVSPPTTLWRWRRAHVWLGLALLVGVALLQLPLFGVLGFELALAMALFASVAGLDLGAAAAHQARRAATFPADDVSRVFGGALVRAVRAVVLALAVPMALAALHGLWTPTCDWAFGVRAYALMPGVTGVLAAGVGVTLGWVIPRRRAARTTALVLVWLALALLGVYRFYSEPPVFTYAPIIGYFPGNMYDEDVVLGAPLYWARLQQALAVAAMLGLLGSALDRGSGAPRLATWRDASRPRRLVMAASALAAGLAGWLHHRGGDLGFAVDADDIEAAMGGRLETAHFVITYEPTPEILADLPLIAADHEFRLAQVCRTLGACPRGKVHSYYFASASSKARWLGARRVEMAKPWRREIYLEHRDFPHGSLRHELAHVVAAEFGDPVFGVAARPILGVPAIFNPGLIEGLAVAADWPGNPDKDLTPHQAVRAMLDQGARPDLNRLFSLGFLSVASVRSYATAGSFVRFLLDTYGADKVRALYRSGGDVDGVLGQSMGQLRDAWLTMVAAVPVPPQTTEATRERYRQTSVFERPCPHAIAARRARVDRLLAAGRGDEAIALQRAICRDAPDEPAYALELADVLQIAAGATTEEALQIYRGLAARDDVTSSTQAEALTALAAAAARAGDWAAAHRNVAAALALPIEEDDRRRLAVKALVLEHRGPAGPALRAVMFPTRESEGALWSAATAAAYEPDLAIAQYLLGLQLDARRGFAGAAAALRRALELGLPDAAMTRRAARTLAEVATRLGDDRALELALAQLEGPTASAMDRLIAADWRDRRAATSR